jgi:hypothetical protein
MRELISRTVRVRRWLESQRLLERLYRLRKLAELIPTVWKLWTMSQTGLDGCSELVERRKSRTPELDCKERLFTNTRNRSSVCSISPMQVALDFPDDAHLASP